MRNLAERFEALRADRRSGAAELVRKAAEALAAAAQAAGFSEAALRAAGETLIRAQPAMAPLYNLMQAVIAGGAERVAETCREHLARVEHATAAVVAEGAALIRDAAVVMTHSRSSTVRRALLAAWESGRCFEVIATESRPLCEGAELARELGAAGIPVRLIVDAAAYALLGQTSLVLVGADAVSARGVVNKIGTAALAVAAHSLGVPVYALATFDKFLPPDYQAPEQELRDPSEILAEPGERVTPVNFYFEVTPLEYFTAILSGGAPAA